MKITSHRSAVLKALLVTFLWSTSWVLIKIGLSQIPALTFAGLRFVLAFVCLLPFALRPAARASLRDLRRSDWLRLVSLGVLIYTITQGAQFLGLLYLPAITVTLLFSFTSPLVALMGMGLLNERLTWLQWIGMGLFLGGVVVYFAPVNLPLSQRLGILVVLVGVCSNALSSVLGRSINREARISPLIVTAMSMGIGSILLLGAGLATQGLPRLGLLEWGIVVWLAVVNTAFAYTLWNQTLQTIPAAESSILNGTMTVQIAILAWIFLGEELTWKTGAGLALVVLGTLLVQLRVGRAGSTLLPKSVVTHE